MLALARQFQLKEFVIDNTNAQEDEYPGISARNFELYASTISREAGFNLVYAGLAGKGGRNLFVFKKPTQAQWLKLVVLSNWGDPAYKVRLPGP